MKKVILLALLMPLPAFGQIVENFESGNLANWVESTQGHWNADTSGSLSGIYSLHHIFDNPDAGTDVIGTRIKNLHPSEGFTRWSFLVRYEYEPSSLNNWSVFLMSDKDPVSMSADAEINGYALGVNLTGSDDTLRLWKVKGDLVASVIKCPINWQTDVGSSITVKISVERSPEGYWTVSVSNKSGDLIGTASGSDSELFNYDWFGIYYRYSSSRDMLLWLDDIDIEGIFYQDNNAPVITSCVPAGKRSVEITLNKEPGEGIMIPENISLNNQENIPLSVIKISNLTWLCEFNNDLINRSVNILSIKKICDISANCSQNISANFTPAWAETGDVAITEIMADPLPEVLLPGNEYVEITNRTGYTFNLKNWKLSAGAQYALFPESYLPPSGIIILCASPDTLLFKKYGPVIGFKQFPSLTDAGRLVYISDSSGTMIHGVDYSSSWYRDDLKSNGGWSLEMIDTGFPFYDKNNWTASISKKGGTPGSVNSVSGSNPDISFSGIQNVFPTDSITVSVRFTEPVFNLTDKMKSITVEGKPVIGIYSTDPLSREFSVKLEDRLKKSELCQFAISGNIMDFAGNLAQKTDFKFGLSEPAGPGDILFNEVLFNPLPGDQDYLELYNTSGKILDASRLELISVNDVSGDNSEPVAVSDDERCILPGEYYAITTDTKKISERYFSTDPDHLFETRSLPSMSDDKGHLILYNRELDLIDELVYSDDMQYSLLSTHEGVSLEKTDPGSNSGEEANWHSATESSGWGTPGAPNSVFVELPAADNNVLFSSSKISPNGDGTEDFLTIIMNLKGNGNVVSVMIFDEAGNFIRKLATNLFAGAAASIIWDGTADDGSGVTTGIYIILITLYNDSGKTARWKRVCTVIRNQ